MVDDTQMQALLAAPGSRRAPRNPGTGLRPPPAAAQATARGTLACTSSSVHSSIEGDRGDPARLPAATAAWHAGPPPIVAAMVISGICWRPAASTEKR